MSQKTDLLIAGGAFSGLSLAIATKQALGPDFSVTVCDPTYASGPAPDRRASAIAAGAIRLLRQIGVWQEIESQVQPIHDMIITDSRSTDVVRPTFLTFGGDVAPGEAFGAMVENALLLSALNRRAEAIGINLIAQPVTGFQREPAAITGQLGNGETITARLLVAADGARSRLREQAGIQTVGWDYGQSGIVCTVKHERDHEGRAEEHFLPAGPFAMLPLPGNHSSIVWTERTERANRLCALPKALFQDEMEQRFGLKLGAIEVVDTPKAYPLRLQIARDFVQDRFALLADAAHFMHPIAGQGLNYGLKDVAALTEVLAEAARLGLDIGSLHTLKRYERWRRFDTVSMGVVTDGINRLFSNNSDVLRMARDVGLGLVERLPGLKGLLIRNAAGLMGDVPKLMRGERV